ncbi:hypothetical protein THRCLA_10492 [Thraustotheca clavata]|uniref:DUF676 domain-containing protein n=1 Tax=Thraustotheca clavata TaxID=74557 RepID=A0A1V9YNA4_9STRA|nr:hypothetical protein THRCLA_10492 [Thraustotheca clavata]
MDSPALIIDHLNLVQIHYNQAQLNSRLRQSTMHSRWHGRANLLKSRINQWEKSLHDAQPLPTDIINKPILPKNIFVLVHGVYGSPTDLAAIVKKLHLKFPSEDALIIQSRGNKGKTLRGLEKCGSNLAEEISDILMKYRTGANQHQLSFVGHSLGGLIIRQSLIYLQEIFAKQNIECISYVSVCTPQLGSRCAGGTPSKNMWKFAVHQVLSMSLFYGKTGHELLFEDSPVVPLLESMSSPNSLQMQALQKFKHRTAVAVIEGDQLVSYASASMNPNLIEKMPTHKGSNENWQWGMLHDGFSKTTKFGSMLYDTFEELPQSPPVLAITSNGQPCDAGHHVAISQSMLTNLLTLPWRRMHLKVDMEGIHKVHTLNLHVWPIGLMQPRNSLSGEFIDILVEMLQCDHNNESD